MTAEHRSDKVRHPVVSGAFYSDDPDQLSQNVQQMLAEAPCTQIEGTLVALVVPHAGFVYSGHVAACSYNLLFAQRPERAVLIGSSHRHSIPTCSVYPGGKFIVPTGEFPVDAEAAASLISDPELEVVSEEPHDEEHSLEVQLPFLKESVGEIPIVPILLGQPQLSYCALLGSRVAAMVRLFPSIILASTDLSHYHTQERAVKLDAVATDAMVTLSPDDLWKKARSRKTELCGLAAVVTTMYAAQELGAKQARLLHYATSGDASGDYTSVVGYAAVAFTA
jgi:AmmeMemoRadiSam system protein B